MIIRTLHFITLCLMASVLSNCINTYQKADLKILDAAANQPVELATPDKKIGMYIKVYEVPVKITRLPENPRLVMDFTVADKGHCLVTYVPTQVFVNSKKIANIDFRDFEYKDRQVIELAIEKSDLKKGENVFRIHTGECQFDIDVMKFNSFKLFQR